MSYVVGAYGLFWDRDQVVWEPGSGSGAWQLLGRRNQNRPVLRICDFRYAHGIYVLADDYGPVYVGRASSEAGLGARLRNHHQSGTKSWTRFSWFSVDEVYDTDHEGWALVEAGDPSREISVDRLLNDMEALLITIFGTGRLISGSRAQNQVAFTDDQRWEQVTSHDCLPGGPARKVDQSLITDPWILECLDYE